MKVNSLLVFVLIFIFSCTKEDDLSVDISNIETMVVVKRFDQIFYKANENDLSKIKDEYPYLFPHNIDSIWIKKMNDKDEQELFMATQQVYPNFKTEEKQLEKLFKYIKYYYPKFEEPTIVTVNTNVSIEQKVVYVDSLLFISLDVFLGKDNSIYQDYPKYIKQNFNKKNLIVAVAEELAKPTIFKSKNRNFLSRMVQEGKLLYTLDAFLPKKADEDKIGYSKDQLNWIKSNEAEIWKFFIEKKLLYSTDNKLNRRFLELAPFSKFYLDIDTASPSRVGVWYGWQIVRSYMKNNKTTLQDMLAMNNEDIFKKSRYKPRK